MSTTATTPYVPSTPFTFPKSHNYPPFFTPQPTLQTRQAQLTRWSTLIQRYSRHHRRFTLSLVDALDSELFHNATLKKRLSLNDARAIIDFMASPAGDHRAEWMSPEKNAVWIWWRKPDEWAALIAAWVEETGQKGVVLTLYELVEGEATENQEFYGLDMQVLRRALDTLVKKGKAQVFGTDDQQGVKFF